MNLDSILGLVSRGSHHALSQQELLTQMLYGQGGGGSLSKALPLATDAVAGLNGGSLIGESLDRVMRYILQQPGDFAPLIKRYWFYKALSVLEQNVIMSRLSRGHSSTRVQGKLGPVDAPVFERQSTVIKFRGKTFSVTDAMQLVGSRIYGDVKAMMGTAMLKKMLLEGDRDLYWGDEDLDPQNINGFFKQNLTDNDHLVNLAQFGSIGGRTTIIGGGSLTLEQVVYRTPAALGTGGFHTLLACSPLEKVALGVNENSKERWIGESRLARGQTTEQITSHFGEFPIDVVWDVALSHERGKTTDYPINPADPYLHPGISAKLPQAPVVAALAGGFLPGGTFYYGVAPVNEFGEGEIVMQTTGVLADAVNGSAEVTWNQSTDLTVTSYRVYRSSTAGNDRTKMRLVGEIKRGTAATQTLVDMGSFVPGSRRALLQDESSLSLGELVSPAMVDLAKTDFTDIAATNWAFGLTIYDQLQRQVEFMNIGGSVTDPV